MQKITNFIPKVATHAAGTFLGAIIGVSLMILKGVGANKK